MAWLKCKDEIGCDILINLNNVAYIEFSDNDKPIICFLDEGLPTVCLGMTKQELIDKFEGLSNFI
jgi:hypothetical protein